VAKNTINRKRIESSKKSSEEDILCCHLEVGEALSRWTLFTVDYKFEKFQLISEIELPPQQLIEQNSGGIKVSSKEKRFTNINKISEQILAHINNDSNLNIRNIKYITADSDFYSELTSPEDIQELVKEILDSYTKCASYNFDRITPEKPMIAGNEIRSKAISRGAKRIISGKKASLLLPHAFLDLSTYTSGLTHSNTGSGKLTGLISGLGMNIFDAIARAHGDLDPISGTNLQLPEGNGEVYEKEVDKCVSEISNLINLRRIPSGTDRVGKIPVNVDKSYEEKIKLIGCDIGKNGSDLDKITKIGRRAASFGTATLNELVNKSISLLIGKIISILYNEELINSESKICISGRESFSEYVIGEIKRQLKNMGFDQIGEKIIFIENPSSFGFIKKEKVSCPDI